MIALLEDTEQLYQLYSINGQEEDADAELYQKYDNNANYDSDSGNAVFRKESPKNKGDKTQRLYAQGVKDEWNKRLEQVIAKTIKLNDESQLGGGFCPNKKHSRYSIQGLPQTTDHKFTITIDSATGAVITSSRLKKGYLFLADVNTQ